MNIFQGVVLAEKPLISEETDLLEPSLLDELICHISSLASVYHKPPSSFVAGRTPVRRAALPAKLEQTGEPDDGTPVLDTAEAPVPSLASAQPAASQPAGGDSLIGDLLSMDLTPKPTPVQPTFQPQPPVQQAPPCKSAQLRPLCYFSVVLFSILSWITGITGR